MDDNPNDESVRVRSNDGPIFCMWTQTTCMATAWCKSSPIGGFRWLEGAELDVIDTEYILCTQPDSNICHIYKVDIQIPAALHSSCIIIIPSLRNQL